MSIIAYFILLCMIMLTRNLKFKFFECFEGVFDSKNDLRGITSNDPFKDLSMTWENLRKFQLTYSETIEFSI